MSSGHRRIVGTYYAVNDRTANSAQNEPNPKKRRRAVAAWICGDMPESFFCQLKVPFTAQRL